MVVGVRSSPYAARMQVSPSVRAVQVPDDDPMHPQFTSIYIVGQDQVLTIDSGEALERYKWMLRGYLAASAVGAEPRTAFITSMIFS